MPELEVPFGIWVMWLQDWKNVPAPTPTGPQQQLDIWTPTPQQIPRVDLSWIGVWSMGIWVIPWVWDIRQPLIQQPIQPRPQVELPSFLQPQIWFQPIVPQVQAPIEQQPQRDIEFWQASLNIGGIPSAQDIERQANESIIQEDVENKQSTQADQIAKNILMNDARAKTSETIKSTGPFNYLNTLDPEERRREEFNLALGKATSENLWWIGKQLEENQQYFQDYVQRKIWAKDDNVEWFWPEVWDFLLNAIPAIGDVGMIVWSKWKWGWRSLVSRNAVKKLIDLGPEVNAATREIVWKIPSYTSKLWLDATKFLWEVEGNISNKAKSLYRYVSGAAKAPSWASQIWQDFLWAADTVRDLASKSYLQWDFFGVHKIGESVVKGIDLLGRNTLGRIAPLKRLANAGSDLWNKYALTRWFWELIKDAPQYITSPGWLNQWRQWVADNMKRNQDSNISDNFNKKFWTQLTDQNWDYFKSQLNSFDDRFESAKTQQEVLWVAKDAKSFLGGLWINMNNYADYKFARDEALKANEAWDTLSDVTSSLDNIYMRNNRLQRFLGDFLGSPVVVKSTADTKPNVEKNTRSYSSSSSPEIQKTTVTVSWKPQSFFDFKEQDITNKTGDQKFVSDVDKTFQSLFETNYFDYIAQKRPDLFKKIQYDWLTTPNGEFAPFQLKSNVANATLAFSKKIRDIREKVAQLPDSDPQVKEYNEKEPKMVQAFYDWLINYVESGFTKEAAQKAEQWFGLSDKSETYSSVWNIPWDKVFNQKVLRKGWSAVWDATFWAINWLVNSIAGQINNPILSFVNLDNSNIWTLMAEDATNFFPEGVVAAGTEFWLWKLFKGALPKWKVSQTLWWAAAGAAWEVAFDKVFTEWVSWVPVPWQNTAVGWVLWGLLGAKDLYSKERARWISSYSDLSNEENLDWTHRQLFLDYNGSLGKQNSEDLQKWYLKKSIDTLVSMDKLDPKKAKEEILRTKEAQIVVASANLMENDVARSVSEQVSNWVYNPQWALTQQSFNDVMTAKASGKPMPKLEYNQEFLQSSEQRANEFRSQQVQSLDKAKQIASQSSSTPDDVLAALSPKVFQNWVEIKPKIWEWPAATVRKKTIEMLPTEIDWVKIDYNNATPAQIRQGINLSTDIWPKTKAYYIKKFEDTGDIFETKAGKIAWRISQYIANPSNYVNRFLRKATGTDLNSLVDFWVSEIYTNWRLNEAGRKMLNDVMLTGKEFDNYLTAQVEESNNLWTQRLYAYDKETKWFPPKVKWVLLPKDFKWNIERKVSLANKQASDLIHHPGSHILYVTGYLWLDTLIMQLNNSLNWYQRWYTEDWNLKPNARSNIKNFIVTPGEYAHPQEYVDLIESLYPNYNWKDLLYDVWTDDNGKPILSDSNTKIWGDSMADWFWIFKISGDFEKDILLNSIYNTAKFKNIYQGSRANYAAFLKAYIKKYGVKNQDEDRYISNIPEAQLNRPDPIALTLQDTIINNYSKVPWVSIDLLRKARDWRVFETIVRIFKGNIWDQSLAYKTSIEFLTDIIVNNRNDLVDLLTADYFWSEAVNDNVYKSLIENQEPEKYGKANNKTINNYSMALWFPLTSTQAGQIKWKSNLIKKRAKSFYSDYSIWYWLTDYTQWDIDRVLNNRNMPIKEKAESLMNIAATTSKQSQQSDDIQQKALNAVFWLDLWNDAITIANSGNLITKNSADFLSEEFKGMEKIDEVEKEIIKFLVNPDKELSPKLRKMLATDKPVIVSINVLADLLWLPEIKVSPEYTDMPWDNQSINEYALSKAKELYGRNFKTIYEINRYLISKDFLWASQWTKDGMNMINDAWKQLQQPEDNIQYVPWNEGVLLYWDIDWDWQVWVYRNWQKSFVKSWKATVEEQLPDLSNKLLVFEWDSTWGNINSQYPLYITKKKRGRKTVVQVYADPEIDWLEPVVNSEDPMKNIDNEYTFWKTKSDNTPKAYWLYNNKFFEIVSDPNSSQLDVQIAFADMDILNRYRKEPVYFWDEWWVILPENWDNEAYGFVTDAVNSVFPVRIGDNDMMNKILSIEISSRLFPNSSPDDTAKAIKESVENMQNNYEWLQDFDTTEAQKYSLIKRISLWSIYNQVALDDLKSQFQKIDADQYELIAWDLIESSVELVDELILQEKQKIQKTNKKQIEAARVKQKELDVKNDKALNPARNIANFTRMTTWEIINAVPLLRNTRAFMDAKIADWQIAINIAWQNITQSIPDLIDHIYKWYEKSADKLAYIAELNSEINRIWTWWWAVNTQISQDALSLVKFFEYVARPEWITMPDEYLTWLAWVRWNVLENWFDYGMLAWLRNIVGWKSMFLKYMWVMNNPFYSTMQTNFNYIFENLWSDKLSDYNIARVFSEIWYNSKLAEYQSRWQNLTRWTRDKAYGALLPFSPWWEAAVWLWLMFLSYWTNLFVATASTIYQWFSTLLMSNVLKKDKVFSNKKLNKVIKDAWLGDMVSLDRFFTESAFMSLGTGLQNYLIDTNMQSEFIKSAMNNLLVRKWYVNDSDINNRLYKDWSLSVKDIAELRIEVDKIYKQYFWLAVDYQDNAFKMNYLMQVLTLNGKRWLWAWRNFVDTMTYWKLNMREVKTLEDRKDPSMVKADNAVNYEAMRIFTTMAYGALFAMRFARLKEALEWKDEADLWSFVSDVLKFKDYTTRQAQYIGASWLLRIQKNLLLDSLGAVIPDSERDWFVSAMLWSDLNEYNWWYKVYFDAFDEYTRGLSKLLIIPSSIVQWIASAAKVWDAWLVWERLAEAMEYRRWAYANYLSDQITNKYWLHTPRNRNSWINSLIGIQGSDIKDIAYSVNDFKQKVASQSLAEALNYVAYRIPVINTIYSVVKGSEYIPDKEELFLSAAVDMNQLSGIRSAYKDGWFQWEENPDYDLSPDFIEHAFAKITDSWIYGKWEWKPFAEGSGVRISYNENKDALINWNLRRAFPDEQSYNEFIASVGSMDWATPAKTNQLRSYVDILARIQAWIKDGKLPSWSEKVFMWAAGDYLYDKTAKRLWFFWAWDKKFYENKEMTQIAKSVVVNELGPYMHSADKQWFFSMITFYARERLPEKYQPLFNKMEYKDEKTWEMKEALFFDSSFKDPVMSNIILHDIVSTDLIARGWSDAPAQMLNAFSLIPNMFEFQEDPVVKKYAQDLSDSIKLWMIIDYDQKVKNSSMSEMEQMYFMMPLLSSNLRVLNKALDDQEFQKIMWPEKLALMSDIMLWRNMEYEQLPDALADLDDKASKAEQWWFARSSWYYSSNPSSSSSRMSSSGNKFNNFVKSNFSKLKVSNAQKRRWYDPRSRNTPTERQVLNRRIKYLAANTEEFTKPSKSAKWKKSASTINRGRASGRRARIKGPSQTSRKNSNKV